MARQLTAALRNEKGRHAATRLRREDRIPAVIYREGKPGDNLSIPRNEWVKILSSGERVVTLKIEGGDRQALIKAVQYDPLGEFTLHVDFNELREGQKVRVAVPIALKGVPKGQAEGGMINQPLHTLHVECLPTQIPDKITIEIESLKIDDAIHVKDIKLPDGVVVTDNADLIAVSVYMPRAEVTATAAEAGPTEPEVLTAKKEDESAGAEGAKAPGKKDEKKKDDKK